jgi:fimbrial isopeptide formation D2 family protein/uncharacterized repeat protein (TIGR01451 family)
LPLDSCTRTPSRLRNLLLATVLGVVASTVTVLGTASVAQAAASIGLDKAAPASVLLGEAIEYRLTAANPEGGEQEYNLSFSDVLPAGVTYQPGSTTPADLGDPEIHTTTIDGQQHQVLVWANVSDLALKSAVSLSFAAKPDVVQLPVGSEVTNTAHAYVNTDPRYTPAFDANGDVKPGSFTEQASATAQTTSISAISVDKSERSPENELVRGAHDRSTVYTIKIKNNTEYATVGDDPSDGVDVVDYLPAGLEFLGCGGEDNSTGGEEYAGSGSLSGTPPISDCIEPTSVRTVQDPPGHPAGVYTEVSWDIGALSPAATTTIKYAAAIALRENTMDFGGITPAAESLEQGSNLDNNTGASTRETTAERSYTNDVEAEGVYTGPTVNADGTPSTNKNVEAADSQTVTSEDVAVAKKVDTTSFVGDGIATYTLELRTSEYTDAGNIVITDVLPDGLCPLDDVQNYAGTAECGPDPSFAVVGAEIDTVTQQADGTFTVTFKPLDLSAEDGVHTIEYQARMRKEYVGSGHAENPTVSGDQYVNDVSLTAVTDPIAGTAESGSQDVWDDSSATIGSDQPSLDKKIGTEATSGDCATADYIDTDDATDRATISFAEGSQVCFRIRVEFSNDNSTRDVILTDLLPDGVTYDAGSLVKTGDVPVAEETIDGNSLEWKLGVPQGSGSALFVPTGGVFEATFSAGVTSAPVDGADIDVTGNLAKLRYNDSSGRVSALRDKVDLFIPSAPPVGIDKVVEAVDGVPNGAGSAEVRGGAVATFGIDVSNGGAAANLNDQAMHDIVVWDALPVGIGCDPVAGLQGYVSSVGNNGVCTDPGDSGQPTFAGRDSRSAISWTVPGPLDPGSLKHLSYDVRFTDDVSVSAALVNNAWVQSFQTHTNDPDEPTQTHYPADNVDTGVDPDDEDTPAATDAATVTSPQVVVAKSNTSRTDTNNTTSQAVVGEAVTYTITATIPAHTTVYHATVTDPMPTGLTAVSATADWSALDDDTFAALPADVSVDAGTGTLTFPDAYTNDTSTGQVFRVTLNAKVTTDTGNVHGKKRTNTATFSSSTALTGGSVTPRPDSSTTTVVAPAPTLLKSDDTDDEPVASGQTVRYTLTASNAVGRPTLYDTTVIDCVPAGLTVTGIVGSPADASYVVGGAPCATDQTLITWTPDAVVTGTPKTLSYDVTVDPSVAGSAAYMNKATLTGSTIDDNANDGSTETVLTATAEDTITAQTATVTKTADPLVLRPGERGSWTISASIPKDVNFFDASVIDQIPAELDPASIVTTSVTCKNDDDTACVLPGSGAELDDAAGTVGWFLGDLTSTSKLRTVTIVYTGKLKTTGDVTRGEDLDNIADLRWNTTNTTDPTSAGTSFAKDSEDASAKVTVQEPLLSIDKTVDHEAPAPGDDFTYKIVVTNSNADNVTEAYHPVITDSVPDGVVVDEATIAPAGILSSDGRTITWTLDAPIAKNASRTLSYQATLDDSANLSGAGLTNTANVASYESLAADGKTYSGPDDEAVVTPVFPHVTVHKVVLGGADAYLGEDKSWQITVENDSPTTAYHVSISDLLPANWLYQTGSATVVVDGGPATPVEPETSVGDEAQTLDWADIGDLPPSATATIVLTAVPQPGAVVGDANPHTNTASVSAEDATGASGSGAGDYHSGPADAQALIASADVAIKKTHTDVAVSGAALDWTLHVSNNGPDTATGPFAVTDTLPTNVVSATATGTGWSCGTVGTKIICTYGDAQTALADGAALPDIDVSALIDSTEPKSNESSNTASVTNHSHDPDTDNNSSTDVAILTTEADLEITKLHPAGPKVTAGAVETYTIAVTNHGPSTSRGPIVVSDPVPDGASFVSADGGASWDCDQAAGIITCTHAGDLLVGQAAADQIVVQVEVDADRTAGVTNQATITSSGTTDPNSADDDSSVTTGVERSADLSIDKSSTGTFTPGSSGTYRLTVRNNAGPSTAKAVKVTDTLPGYLSYDSFTAVSGDWDCSAVGQLVTCDLTGDLGVDESASVDLKVAVASSHTGAIENDATVSSQTPDPDPGNDTDGDDATSDLKSDLSITKSHTGDPVAGELVAYELAVSNDGPSDIDGTVSVTDPIPAGLSYDADSSATGAGWDCDVAARLLTCTRDGVLADGTDAPPITLKVRVDSDVRPSTIVNTATVAGPAENTEIDLTNNSDSDPTDIVDDANISITKEVDGSTDVVAGTTVTYLLEVHNDGPSDTDTVVVDDPMPSGLSIKSVDAGAGWICDTTNPLVLSCSRDTIAAGATAPAIGVTADVASGLGRADDDPLSIENTATAQTPTAGDDPADNDASASIDIVRDDDLVLRKSHGSDPVVAGRTVTFDLDVTNAGDSDARGPLTIVDSLPAGLTYVGSTGAWDCVADTVTPAGQDVTCTSVGLDFLVAGADAPTLELITQVDADQAGTALTNSATVGSPTPETTTANNTATDQIDPSGLADLSVVKTHQGQAHVGDDLAFDLAVHNDGPSDAEKVVVTDELPAGLDYVSAEGDGWTCAEASRTVTCQLDDPLASGADADPITVTATVRPAAYPTVTNTAVVASDTVDSNPTNDSSDDEVSVPALSNLTIAKSHTGSLKVGQPGEYLLRVTNSGPTSDPGPITVRDALPVGLSYVSATGVGWTCSSAPGAGGTEVVTCQSPTGLAKDASSDIKLTTDVGTAAYPSVTNTAEVGTVSEETSTTDNQATDEAAVLPTVELSVEKSVLKQTATQIRWKISVTNHGPSATVDPVVVVDRLPRGLTFEQATGAGWACAVVGKKVTCTHAASMADEEVSSVVLSTDIHAEPGTKLSNTATVTSGDTDGEAPTDVAATTVRGSHDVSDVGSGSAGALPNTGGPSWWPFLGGLGLLLAGIGLVWPRLRRTR